ncbi:hypothetical protein GA830_10610 [Mesorhizobium sp. NBSH29]|uniref:hypothetical protein n=1 Tax=Mesorhizobium sp. NBSH29 TaxID=2654249 RepID=UPI0018964302|nr:hypothetical protein [Mesorhizobium sp. NBSH29]QPC87143.1 hypothetical protein GA830_10610 [Mesorhizobium sp. NBSH29]
MAVFTVGGREVIASLLINQTFFLALGKGDPAWDTNLIPPSPGATDLVDKVGVTRLRQIDYASPSETGEITMADGSQFTVSPTPTRYLYLWFKLDLPDAVPSTLRECGLYHGTVLGGAVPAGQFYVPGADVVAYGKLVHLDRYNSIVRDGTIEQGFSFILTL